jgi:hypothetical protein
MFVAGTTDPINTAGLKHQAIQIIGEAVKPISGTK